MEQALCSGDLQRGFLMVARAVEDERCVGAGGDLTGNFLQMQVHRFGVGVGQDEGGDCAPTGASGAEQVCPFVALVARRADGFPVLPRCGSMCLADPRAPSSRACRRTSWNQISSGFPFAASGIRAGRLAAKPV